MKPVEGDGVGPRPDADLTLPNFLILGAQKAGTTTLYELLRRHPSIYMPAMKEPGFFIRGFDDPVRIQTLRRPDDGRHATLIGARGGGCYTLDAYRALFEPGASFPLRGEASTPYLPSPYAAHRIAELLPGARLIVLLRDPVERAFSAYNYNLSRGMEPSGTFAQAVASELRGERDDWVYGWRYLYSGLYADHLQRYLERFPRQDLAVFRFESLRDDAGGLMDEACLFLGVEPVAIPTAPVERNVTTVQGNPLLRLAKTSVTSGGPVKRIARRVVPRGVRARIGKGILGSVDRFGVRPAPMPPEVDAQLRDYFREPNRRLADLLEMNLDSWSAPD